MRLGPNFKNHIREVANRCQVGRPEYRKVSPAASGRTFYLDISIVQTGGFSLSDCIDFSVLSRDHSGGEKFHPGAKNSLETKESTVQNKG